MVGSKNVLKKERKRNEKGRQGKTLNDNELGEKAKMF